MKLDPEIVHRCPADRENLIQEAAGYQCPCGDTEAGLRLAEFKAEAARFLYRFRCTACGRFCSCTLAREGP